MSKHSLRFSEAQLEGGALGTARISQEAKRIKLFADALPGGAPLVGAVQKLVAPDVLTRTRALGRMKAGEMNKTEGAYAAHLDARRHIGEVLWFRFEGMKFRLADNTFYTPDFAVMVASGQIELHECKGFMEEDANVKIKVAASQYPFVFRLVRKAKGGEWDIREV
ncbi:hypothetical protein [Paraburkholderia kururiensis]|uniref:hypothetical protein n=1 Tax=Paraburkholderia kururiensis TaxID=984307 RepID=UPI000370E3D6|nr:hypothetical protein [Paraburkholderia kururiensis]